MPTQEQLELEELERLELKELEAKESMSDSTQPSNLITEENSPGLLETIVSPISALSTVVQEPLTSTRTLKSELSEYGKGLPFSQDLAKMARRAPGYEKVLESQGIPNNPMMMGERIGMPRGGQMVPFRQAIGTMLDIVSPEQLVAGEIAGQAAKGMSKIAKIPEWLQGVKSNNISKVIARTAKESDNVNPVILGERLATQDKMMPISNPKKMVDQLVGKEIIESVDTPYGAKITSKRTEDGIIKSLSDDIDNTLINSKNNTNKITKEDIKNRIIQNHPPMSTEMNVEADDIQKTIDFLNKKDVFPWEDLDLKSANDLKRNINAHTPSKAYGQPLDKAISEGIEQKKRISQAIKDLIEERLSPEEAQAFSVKNNILSNNLDLLKVYDPKYHDNLKKIGFIDATISSLLGFAGGQSVGMGGYGAAVGAFSPAMQMAREAGRTGIPTAKASIASGLKSTIESAPNIGAIGARSLVIPDQINNRSPQSIEEVMIPRDTNKILENPPLIAKKLAQVDPKLADQFMNIATKHPEQMRDFMGMHSNVLHEMFEPDKYARWDGAIRRDLIPMYTIDLLKDQTLSNTERARLLDQVGKTGKCTYTPQEP